MWHHDKKTNEIRGSVRFTTKSKTITAMAKANNNRVLACLGLSYKKINEFLKNLAKEVIDKIFII